MSTIAPESIRGLHAVGRISGTPTDLHGVSFVTVCPPDVGPRTRLLAVCGITDYQGRADPEKDGWFFSDFYLFYYLFSSRHGPSPSQIWMTSEKPEDLVRKYGEYVHGDPKAERKVVLDETMLPRIEESGSLRVVARNDLLERFLCTLREQSLLAKNENQHLVVLIFGHGQDVSFKVALGGDEPNLCIEDFKRALQPDTPVTLFMTSCFSGGWIVQPRVSKATHINVTGITAAGPKAESQSWPVSSSLRRACGSMIASAILQTSIAIEESQQTEEIRTDPTYISFAHSIYGSYKRLDRFAEEKAIHFSAQDDQWELHYRRRSGIPLSQLKLRWDSLRNVPTGDYESEGSNGDGTVTGRFGTLKKRSKVKYLARLYFDKANPGPNNAASNIEFHGTLMGLLNGKEKKFGKPFNDEELDKMYETLKYRLDVLDQANDLAIVMGVTNELFDAYSFDRRSWKRTVEEEERDYPAWRLLIENYLLPKPLESRPWPKPYHYLAACLASSRLSYDEMRQRVELAVDHKRRQAEAISELVSGQIMGDEEVIRRRHILLNKLWNAGYRVRAAIIGK